MKKSTKNIKTPEGFAVIYEKSEPFHSGVGCVADRFWDNPKTKEVLEALFGCRDDQHITAIEVTRTGIKAHFNILLPAGVKFK